MRLRSDREAQPHRLPHLGYSLVEMAEEIFSETLRRLQERVIWR
jgi:hypothetical protein